MFLFNPTASRSNLAEELREEARIREITNLIDSGSYTKKSCKENRVEIIAGIPYQACGGGRRRLATRSSAY